MSEPRHPGTSSSFLETLRRRASRTGARIGFPEAGESRTREALDVLRADAIVEPVAFSGDGVAPLEAALAALASGEIDGVVAGAVHSTATVIRAGLRVLGVADGFRTVSSSFYMVLEGQGGDRVLTFTDAGVVPNPTPDQLAESADAAARARRLIVGDEPRVAFLSYSTKGSAEGPSVERVREGLSIFRRRCPDVAADGEFQADAALVEAVGRAKAPGSAVAGSANVLVFPDLSSGNIAYKLVERLAGARALGPVLQGLAGPLNDLSRGASAADIVDVACVTAIMSQGDHAE